MHKKQDGEIKPLWVKCQCGKWNGVQPGAVVKYLEKIIGHQAAGLPVATRQRQGEDSNANAET